MNKILELFNNLEKSSAKWNTYFDVYERHLSKFVDKSPTILEIGILNGGSIELWLKYFGKNTKVIGLDIESKNYQYDGDVILEKGDQGSPEFWDQFLSRHKNFDIVIDDGGHTMSQQNITLNKVFPHLNDNGVFLVEDTHTSYWSGWGGSLNGSETFQNKAKNLTDVINKEHIKENHLSEEVTKTFIDLYSISFYNSIVVLEKRKTEPFVCLTNR